MNKVKEFLVKYRVGIVVIVVICLTLFFMAKSCNRQQLDELHGKNEALKEQVKKAQDGTAVIEKDRIRLRDSIKLEDIKKEERIKSLTQIAEKSKNKVKELEQQNSEAKKKIRNMNLVEVANTLNSNYGSKDATATSNSVDIKGSMPYLVLETISDANTAQDIIKEKDAQISAKDSVIVVKDEQLKSSSVLLFSAEKSLNSYKEVSQLQSKLTESLEKENRKIRRQNTFNKILIPLAGAAGIFIGVKTSR